MKRSQPSWVLPDKIQFDSTGFCFGMSLAVQKFCRRTKQWPIAQSKEDVSWVIKLGVLVAQFYIYYSIVANLNPEVVLLLFTLAISSRTTMTKNVMTIIFLPVLQNQYPLLHISASPQNQSATIRKHLL